MRVAVLGASGQLGRDLTAAFGSNGDAVVALSHQDVDITSPDSVVQTLTAARPDLVVNSAAFANVDGCEADPARAFSVNALGARNIARAAQSIQAKLIYISTDYVFNGNKRAPYIEEDIPAPLNVYGNTKLSGEYFVRSIHPHHFVVRVSGLYGFNPCRSKGGLNFVEMMLKLSREREEIRVVDDEFISPTPTSDISRQLVVLGQTSEYGVYHATAEGSCSWYEFAQAIFDLAGAKVRLERARPGEFPAKVPRPKYSVLENRALKMKSLNVFTSWHEGLQSYLAGRIEEHTKSGTIPHQDLAAPHVE
jgi:dTDP-4-dehydrorhamnose reductase